METIVQYVLVHTPTGDIGVKYEGMGIQVISDMLATQDLTGTVITENEFNDFVEAHKRPSNR